MFGLSGASALLPNSLGKGWVTFLLSAHLLPSGSYLALYFFLSSCPRMRKLCGLDIGVLHSHASFDVG